MKKYLFSFVILCTAGHLLANEDTLPVDSVVNLQGVVVSANKTFFQVIRTHRFL